jgi:predicted RNase H-like HicB family nuclease
MKNLRIIYQRHAPTGMFAATSPDLPGFLVMAKTFDQVLDEIPIVAADLIQQRTGDEVVVEWTTEAPSDSGFTPLSSEMKVLEAA